MSKFEHEFEDSELSVKEQLKLVLSKVSAHSGRKTLEIVSQVAIINLFMVAVYTLFYDIAYLKTDEKAKAPLFGANASVFIKYQRFSVELYLSSIVSVFDLNLLIWFLTQLWRAGKLNRPVLKLALVIMLSREPFRISNLVPHDKQSSQKRGMTIVFINIIVFWFELNKGNQLSRMFDKDLFEEASKFVRFKVQHAKDRQDLDELLNCLLPPNQVQQMRKSIYETQQDSFPSSSQSQFANIVSRASAMVQYRQATLAKKPLQKYLENIMLYSESFRICEIESLEDVTILRGDIVGFTKLSTTLSPDDLVQNLNRLYSYFDSQAKKYDFYRIKTLGDCYYGISSSDYIRKSGNSSRNYHSDEHAISAVKMALSMMQYMNRFSLIGSETPQRLDMRIGIHTGRVYAGIIGLTRLSYDFWGEDVQIAMHCESSGKPGFIHVSQSTVDLLGDQFICEPAEGDEFLKERQIKSYFIGGYHLDPRAGNLTKLRSSRGSPLITSRSEPVDERATISDAIMLIEQILMGPPEIQPTAMRKLQIQSSIDLEQVSNIKIDSMARKQWTAASYLFNNQMVHVTLLTIIAIIWRFIGYCSSQNSLIGWNMAIFLKLIMIFSNIGSGFLLEAIGFHHYMCLLLFEIVLQLIQVVTIRTNTQELMLITIQDELPILMSLIFNLKFLYLQQQICEAKKRLKNVSIIDEKHQKSNLIRLEIVSVILPPHLVDYFLHREKRIRHEYRSLSTVSSSLACGSFDDLCTEKHEGVTVMFASIMGFEAGSVSDINLLRKIVYEFDLILEEHKAIDKIKTNCNTYMAAAGLRAYGKLSGTNKNNQDILEIYQKFEQSITSDGKDLKLIQQKFRLACMIQFVNNIMDRLNIINEHERKRFELRVGVNSGPLVAGVVAAEKPCYDLWGDTVNVASRMENLGKGSSIHMNEETFNLVRDELFDHLRVFFSITGGNKIYVKGRGRMVTYLMNKLFPIANHQEKSR